MMGKQSEQIQMVILDVDSMIPENHLRRRIKKTALTYTPHGVKSAFNN